MVVEPEGKSMVTFYTTGDGNCGYRSLSTLLTGVEDYHWHIRLKIYEYISYNGENIYGIRSAELAREYYVKYQHLLNVPPQPVNQDLYAGNDDFYALADMLECNIYTYTPDPLPSYPNVNSHFKDNIKINGAPTLFLMYLNNNHYEPIISFQ
uniref:OTU domain-containing protein n=1 Tax=Panagrolaimus superbus TaxID=310955 RepID=A0A914YK64_9BILA